MTQADSVHSTPRTNSPIERLAESVDSFSAQPATGQPETAKRTSESRKPTEGLSRRVMLGALAVLPTALPAAAADQDPVFQLIEAHRVAGAAHAAAIREADRLEGLHRGSWGRITEKPCHNENEAFEILLGAAATTLPGLFAKLRYLRAIAAGDEAWMIDEREGAGLLLIDSLTVSLKNAGVQA